MVNYRNERMKNNIMRSFTPVEKVQDHENPKQFLIREVESKKIISKVSKRYSLIQNEKIFKPFLDRFGIESLKMFTSYGKGKFCSAKFGTGREFNFGTNERPDIVEEQILVRTSYDKTKSFSFMMGAFRRVCLNGLYSGQMTLSYRKIHVGYIPVDDIVHSALTLYTENSFDSWNQLRYIKVTPEKAQEVMQEYKTFPNLKENLDIEKMNKGILKSALDRFGATDSIEIPKNGWGLYNAFNRKISLYVTARSKLDSVVNANKRLENYLLEKL